MRYHETRPEYRRAEVPVIRLLIVLAVVILMAFYMNYNSPRGGGEAGPARQQQPDQRLQAPQRAGFEAVAGARAVDLAADQADVL